MSEELELENRLRVKINPKELTAKIVKSPNVTGTVIVPQYAVSEKKNTRSYLSEIMHLKMPSVIRLYLQKTPKSNHLKVQPFFILHSRNFKFHQNLRNLIVSGIIALEI